MIVCKIPGCYRKALHNRKVCYYHFQKAHPKTKCKGTSLSGNPCNRWGSPALHGYCCKHYLKSLEFDNDKKNEKIE